MGHPLVDEALADIAARGSLGGRGPCDLGFLLLTLGRVGQQVIGVARAHDPRPGQREGHARGVYSDPAPAPLLGYIGRGAGTTGRV